MTLTWWAFAFWPVGEESLAWLEAAKLACFGTLESGLPDASGWMILTLGPPLLLVVLIAGWSQELKLSFHKFYSSPMRIPLSAFILIALVTHAVWVGGKIQAGFEIQSQGFSSTLSENFPENYPQRNVEAMNFQLIDQSGSEIELQNLLNSDYTVVITFAFAQCRTICPAIINQLKTAAKNLDARSTRLLVVTLDPWRDTPRAIASWAERLSIPKNVHLLTGNVPDVEAVLRAYDIPSKRNEKTGDVDHPALTHVIGSSGKIKYTLGNVPSAWIEQAVRRAQIGL